MASELSIERQTEIIHNYMNITGQKSNLQSSSIDENQISEQPIKCGMSIISSFRENFSKLDKNLLQSTGVQVLGRPTNLPNTRVSPSGKFLIHYTTTGDSAIYSNVPGGAEGYIDSVARIFDYVYNYEINTLGYPEPLLDSSYASGGDEKYDVYMVNFSQPYYGAAYPDSIMELSNGDSVATAFLMLDNDYNEIPQYENRPLDAVRVTAAHEFFHMVQFAIDFEESEEVSNVVYGKAWMEMSSVWMEDEVYDNINDYYYYLPYFFDSASASIQQFKGPGDLHPYASCVFPMFLSQNKINLDKMWRVWSRT